MSSAMTEVAVRLAEPDRAAEQSAASLGQAVRRQVSFMNEAISRALGRAGELEALVHNEVSALEKSYSENEHKIRGLIQELAGERHALVSTTDKVVRDAQVDGQRGAHPDRQAVPAADQARQDHRGRRAEPDRAGEPALHRQRQPGDRRSPTARSSCRRCSTTTRWRSTPRWPAAPRRSTSSCVERTRALDAAFAERLRCFDETMLRSTVAIDRAVSEKARALTDAHGEPRARAVRHAGPAGQPSRRVDDARARRRAPHQRQHHPPVAQGHRRPVGPGRHAQERVGEPAAPDVRRHQQVRQPGPVHRDGGERAGDGQQADRFHPAEAARAS